MGKYCSSSFVNVINKISDRSKIMISIAMTTYNGIKYIKQLLDSIQNQTEKPDEVIIVDDNSSDGTYEFVNEYIARNGLNNWNNYRNKKNIGWRANFRKALRKCSGDIIFLCDQDDVWMPYKILEMTRVMEQNSDIELLTSNYFVMNADRKEKVLIKGLNKDDGSVEKKSLKKSFLTVMRPGCTYCVRKSLTNQIWREDLPSAPHDAILWGYAAIDDSLYLFNRKTIQFRRHSESASNPSKSLCVTRRIDELNHDIENEMFFLEISKKRQLNDVQKMIENQLSFYKQRKKILEQKSFFKMIFFQIKYFNSYPTLRNMLSDDYVLLFKQG